MTEYSNGLTGEQQNLLDSCSEQYMIGALSSRDNAIYADSYGNIHFFVEPLCQDPVIATETEALVDAGNWYIGDASRQSDDFLPRFYEHDSYHVNENIDFLYELYGDKILIFHPYYSFNRNTGRWYKNLILTGMQEIPNGYAYPRYQVVPVFPHSSDEFERILEGKMPFDLPDYSCDLNDPPEGILCGEYLYLMKNPDTDYPFVKDGEYWKCLHIENMIRLPWKNAENAGKRVLHAGGICFMEFNMINELLIGGSETITRTDSLKEEKVQEVSQYENGEIGFLQNLKQLAVQDGLQYNFEDLVDFHTSLKTTPLTILAGMSGTGKSRLALTYAKMMGLTEENGNLLFLPVTPSFTEPADVLGYYNAMSQSYVPGDTGLVQFLKHAQDHSDQMHMVIFDEMNLSQVEYWFSPFISILEKDEGYRILHLYDSQNPCANAKDFPSQISLGGNLIFVGTVNVDDTTRRFSDRLLDRTFVISLQKIKFIDFYAQYVEEKEKRETVAVPDQPMSYELFNGWKHGNEHNYMEAFQNHTDYLRFYDELDQLIRKYIPDGGISHRVMKNIGNYILNIPLDHAVPLIQDRNALDIILSQTILTKIRGTESQLQSLIGSVKTQTGELDQSELKDLFDQWGSISDFDYARNVLKKKAEELRVNGYTN